MGKTTETEITPEQRAKAKRLGLSVSRHSNAGFVYVEPTDQSCTHVVPDGELLTWWLVGYEAAQRKSAVDEAGTISGADDFNKGFFG